MNKLTPEKNRSNSEFEGDLSFRWNSPAKILLRVEVHKGDHLFRCSNYWINKHDRAILRTILNEETENE